MRSSIEYDLLAEGFARRGHRARRCNLGHLKISIATTPLIPRPTNSGKKRSAETGAWSTKPPLRAKHPRLTSHAGNTRINGTNSLMLRRDDALRSHQRLIPINANRRVKGSTACNLRAFEATKRKNKNKEVKHDDGSIHP